MRNGGLAQHIVKLGTGLWRAVNITVRIVIPMGKEDLITAVVYQTHSAHL